VLKLGWCKVGGGEGAKAMADLLMYNKTLRQVGEQGGLGERGEGTSSGTEWMRRWVGKWVCGWVCGWAGGCSFLSKSQHVAHHTLFPHDRQVGRICVAANAQVSGHRRRQKESANIMVQQLSYLLGTRET
jgi:hypothetical protein